MRIEEGVRLGGAEGIPRDVLDLALGGGGGGGWECLGPGGGGGGECVKEASDSEMDLARTGGTDKLLWVLDGGGGGPPPGNLRDGGGGRLDVPLAETDCTIADTGRAGGGGGGLPGKEGGEGTFR